MNRCQPKVYLFALLALLAMGSSPAAAAERIFAFDDQYVQIEAGYFPAAGKGDFGIEVLMTPKPGWKILADNSSGSKPLRLKVSPGKCLKAKGSTHFSAPDHSATDESGAYSEHYTKSASIRQEFSRQKCSQKGGYEGSAALTYLLCQDNRCVGPFNREIKFKAPE